MTPCQQPSGPFVIFTGDVKVLPLRIAYGTGLPVDITSASEIVVNLPNADGTVTALKLTDSKVAIVSPGVLGQLTANISAIDSAKLNIGELQNIDVTFTIGGNPFTVRFYGALSVFETE